MSVVPQSDELHVGFRLIGGSFSVRAARERRLGEGSEVGSNKTVCLRHSWIGSGGLRGGERVGIQVREEGFGMSSRRLCIAKHEETVAVTGDCEENFSG